MSDSMRTNKEKLKNLLDSQERIVANMDRYEATADFLMHEDVDAAKQEIELIDRFLSGEYLEDEVLLSEDEKVQINSSTRLVLANRKTLDQAHVLVNDHSRTDSPQMDLIFVTFSK